MPTSRAGREHTHELPPTNSSARCVSSHLPIRGLCANNCLQVTVMITAFRALTFAIPPLTPAPQNTLREPCIPACPPRHPCSYPRNFSSELETEAKVIFTLSIELISGETGTGEIRLGRMRVGKASLYTSLLAHLLTGDHPILVYACRLCSDAQFMRSVWRCYDALATDRDTSSASKRMCHHPPHIRWPSSTYVPSCSMSLRRCTV